MSQKPNRRGGSTTRRQFLCRSATTAAGLALGIPSFVPGSALGLGQAAPSERVTLGFIGLGWKGFEGCWGSLLQTFIADLGCQVLAVCDVDRRYLERAKTFVDQTYGNQDCSTYHDFRDLIVRPELDAVVIATPDHWHAVQTIWACLAGKDVFCEKPLSLTIREAGKQRGRGSLRLMLGSGRDSTLYETPPVPFASPANRRHAKHVGGCAGVCTK